MIPTETVEIIFEDLTCELAAVLLVEKHAAERAEEGRNNINIEERREKIVWHDSTSRLYRVL